MAARRRRCAVTARNPPGTAIRQIAAAENTNESELMMKAHSYPNRAALYPASSVPAVSVAHCVVCVREFAVCSSSELAMVGRIAARPLVKNGDANISRPLSR